MSYKIDEDKIVEYAFNKLPNIDEFDKHVVVVYVNDFHGESDVISSNRYWDIEVSEDKRLMIDKKNKNHYYCVIFRKEFNEKELFEWDLVGYHKQEIYEIVNM